MILFFFFFVIVHIKTKDKPCVDRNTLEILKILTRMMATGATLIQIGEVVMKDKDLRDVVKATLLRDVDDQCKKLCKKSDEKSSVLRVPRSKHKVN